MKAMFWSIVARLLARHPVGWRLLLALAARTPYFHLTHSDGTPYMQRYWLMPRWMLQHDENGHWTPKPWAPFSLRVHYIASADEGRDLHDHPFDYRTLLLAGWYIEEDIFGTRRYFEAGTTRAARAETFHRITRVSPGGVITLFVMGKRTNRWGFLVNGHKIYWKNYCRQEP